MEVLNRNIGWKTILLVQFQRQYVCIILMGVFVTTVMSIVDIANIFSINESYQASAAELMWAFDAIYFIDVCTMIIFKIMPWDEAKQVFRPRGGTILFIDALATIPTCILYESIASAKGKIYYFLRLRYAVRTVRLFIFLWNVKRQVGNQPLLTTARELIIVMAVYMLLINLVIFILMINEGFKQTNFFGIMYYTICKTTGKGVPISEDTPHRALIPLIIFTFTAYMGHVYYISAFITSLVHIMNDQFMYVNSLERVMAVVQKWKYHSTQMYTTVNKYYQWTWKKRRQLSKFENFNLVVPESLGKEIMLDVCWNAFKHSHIFRDMDLHYLRYLSTLMLITYMTPGELIYKKGKFKSRMVYLISGVIQILSEEDGETPILSLSGGTCLGETCLFIDQPSSCTVVVKNYSEVCILERKQYFKSYDMYPSEFMMLLKTTFLRYEESKHFRRINKFQLSNSEWSINRQVLTMKWLKSSLYTMLCKKESEKNKSNLGLTHLDDRVLENLFDSMVFCARYLDLFVIAEDYELDSDTILLKSTCPIIFQPESIIIFLWEKCVAVLATILALTYGFYVCVSTDTHNLYTFFIYLLTTFWALDIFIQISTAIKTKDQVITEIYKILNDRLGHLTFWLDLLAALPSELVYLILVGDAPPQTIHTVQINRLIKCYRIASLFEISQTTSATKIIIKKYCKFVTFVVIFVTNLASILYVLMCPKFTCSVQFVEYLERRAININSGFQIMVMCFYLSFQFMGGLVIGEFPVRSTLWFIFAQIFYFFADMYFLADIAASETLRNKDKLKYYEFVTNVNMVMKQWDFDLEFKRRVIKYCKLQWEYDNAIYLLYQEKLFTHVPSDLFKIGCHITYARSVNRIPIFQGLPDETLAVICGFVERIIIPPGEVITYSGEICKEMHTIETGFCEMIAQSRTTAKVLGPGDSFSVVETCLNASTVNTVITLTDCKLLSLTYENYLRALRYFPHVLTEISANVTTAIDWVAFEQLLNKECLDIESYTKPVKSFNVYGYHLDKDSKEFHEFHAPYDRIYILKIFKYVFLRISITTHGEFIKYWEISRSIFAFLTVMLSPMTIVSSVNCVGGYYLLLFLDITAWLDIYVRHHISYFNRIGIEVTHPLKTAFYYWKHGFIIDLLGVFPFDLFIPYIMVEVPDAKMIVCLKINRLLQVSRIYQMFNHYIYTTGQKAWIIIKYFVLVIVALNIISSIAINAKCVFDNYDKKFNDMYRTGVSCNRNSWLSPNESFQHPISGVRVYFYGMYFIATISTFKGLEGFAVFDYGEILEIVLIISFWLIGFPFISAKIIASVMYRNVALVMYQNAMNSLIRFMNYRKIDPVLKNEVIEHFEYIWHKKKGRNEREIFKVFNIALHEDALYYIYGKVIEQSSIFKGASKSFFKSLLLNVGHIIILKRGVISKVNNIHGIVYLLFKGQVEILGPDYNRLRTLPVGSVFGHLDNINLGRQRLSFIAKGHVELLTISSTQFHLILSKYRGIRTHFRSLTSINVDYLINTNKVHASSTEIDNVPSKEKVKSRKKARRPKSCPLNFLCKCKCCKKCRNFCCKNACNNCCKNCNRCSCDFQCWFFNRVYLRSTGIRIWEGFFLGIVCFIGFIIELFQKNSQDISTTIMILLYVIDFLFLMKIYLQFHTAYDDERGLLVTDRKLIAKRYLEDYLGFSIDMVSSIPFDAIAFIFDNEDTKCAIWTYGRFNRVLRIILVLKFFRTINQKLNIKIFFMRILYLMVWVILILQFLVYVLFLIARNDPTMEQYNAYLTKNYRVMTYLRQMKVILHMFTGSQISSYKPNNQALIIVTVIMIIFTRFIIAIFIAETCATLEIVFHNKKIYEYQIKILKNCMIRGSVSPPLLSRVWLYVKLLWMNHNGEQFPALLDEAPYYLREGVLNSMFGFHLRNHPILKNCHVDLIRQMAACMTTRIYFTGNYIAFDGDIDETMYFIHEGEIQVLSDDTLYTETVEFSLKAGQMFGLEQGMYLRCRHLYTYRASTYCVIILLQRKLWIHLLDFFPASKYLIFDKEFEKKLLCKGDVSYLNLPSQLFDMSPNLPVLQKRSKLRVNILYYPFFKKTGLQER